MAAGQNTAGENDSCPAAVFWAQQVAAILWLLAHEEADQFCASGRFAYTGKLVSQVVV